MSILFIHTSLSLITVMLRHSIFNLQSYLLLLFTNCWYKFVVQSINFKGIVTPLAVNIQSALSNQNVFKVKIGLKENIDKLITDSLSSYFQFTPTPVFLITLLLTVNFIILCNPLS